VAVAALNSIAEKCRVRHPSNRWC